MGIKRISLKAIAAISGVSTALASYALSGKEKSNRRKQIAKDLNYPSRQLAKRLKLYVPAISFNHQPIL